VALRRGLGSGLHAAHLPGDMQGYEDIGELDAAASLARPSSHK
jgi:hypothetical protein